MSKDTVRILSEFPSELPSKQLPTNGDVLKAIYFEQQSQKLSKQAAIKKVERQISELWQNTSIPILSTRRVKEKLTTYVESHYRLSKSDSTRQKNEEKKSVFKVRRCI